MIAILLGGPDVKCMKYDAKHVRNVYNVNSVNKRHFRGTSNGGLYDKVGG